VTFNEKVLHRILFDRRAFEPIFTTPLRGSILENLQRRLKVAEGAFAL
jgi:hypothetical protein